MSTPSYPPRPDQPGGAGAPPPARPQQAPGHPPGADYQPPQAAGYGRSPYSPFGAGDAAGESAARNPLGLVSVIVGAVPLLLGLIGPFLPLAIMSAGNYGLYSVVIAVLNGVGLVMGIAALVIGVVAITRKGLPKALAGIGVGLGIAAVWGGLTAFLYPLVADLFHV